MQVRRVALIIFYDDRKRILLQDRRGISKWGEEWGFFGGSLEEGETAEQAVIRETKEELSYDLKDFKFVKTITHIISDSSIELEQNLFISFIGDNLSKFIQLEGNDMRFFTFDEARKLKMTGNHNFETLNILEKSL